MKSLVCICAGTVAVLAAIQSTEAADAGSWQLHPAQVAQRARLRTEPAQVAKTNGVGQADLLWSQPFPVQANRNYILRLPYRTEDASLANLLLLRYTHSADDAPQARHGQRWLRDEVFLEWTSVPKTAEQWRHIHRKVTGVSRRRLCRLVLRHGAVFQRPGGPRRDRRQAPSPRSCSRPSVPPFGPMSALS